MEDPFAWGVIVGMLFIGVCWFHEKRAYQQVLLHIAKHQGREKLTDGNFYYIVPEGEWLRVKQNAASDETSLRRDLVNEIGEKNETIRRTP